jgi:uncharacterized iron-regulated membrane protein
MNSRKILFLTHLGAGLIAGAILFSMACSGVLMTFAPQLTSWAEHGASRARTPADAPPMPPGALMAKAREAFPDARLESLTLGSLPGTAALAGFGRSEKGAFLDPASGEVLGRTSGLRSAFLAIEHWHRWMGEEKRGKALTDASPLALLLLLSSGIRLWLPRRLNRASLKRAVLPDPELEGRAGYRNLHMSIGFWSGSLLLVIALTGAVMAYPWAERVLFAMAGSQAPARKENPPRKEGGEKAKPGKKPEAPAVAAEALDSLWAMAGAKEPGWRTLTIRFPQKAGMPLAGALESPGFAEFTRRSRLSVDAASGALAKWEPYGGMDAGKKVRSWILPLHTGRGFGIPGQILAGWAALGLAGLVWTGMFLGVGRVVSRLRGKAPTGASAALQAAAIPDP